MFIDKKKAPKITIYILSVCCATFCVFCVATRVYQLSCKNLGLFELASMGLIMADGNVNADEKRLTVNDCNIHKIVTLKMNKPAPATSGGSDSNTPASTAPSGLFGPDITDFSIPHQEGEDTYRIIESHFGESGIKYENFFINNKTELDLNIAEELAKRPDIHIKKDGSPQVLIYHTHTCEAYMDKDQGFCYASFYPRTEDNRYNVVRVGDAICASLNKCGIGTVHDVTCHDSPSFNGSYKRSAETIDRNLSQHPSIQVTIDIHRDTIGNNERGKIKPTFRVADKKAAQIMIMTGCDLDGSLSFPDWEYNLRLALRLQRSAERLYPGMTRSLFFGPVKYNMNKTHASLLIEVGTEVNTLDEAVRSGTLIGNALADVLDGLQ